MFARLAAGTSGAALMLGMLGALASTPVRAYEACQSASSASANPGTTTPGGTSTVNATFKDCNGNASAGAGVQFSQQAGAAGCHVSFNPQSTTTDANGQASTVVTLPDCPNGCQYTIAATSGSVTVTTVIKVAGCLPFTAAVRPARSSPGDHLSWVMAAVAATALAGAGLLGLRYRA